MPPTGTGQMGSGPDAATATGGAQGTSLSIPRYSGNVPVPGQLPHQDPPAQQVGSGVGGVVAPGVAGHNPLGYAAGAMAAVGHVAAEQPMRHVKLAPFNPEEKGQSWNAYKIKMRSAFARANVIRDDDKKNALFEVLPLQLIEWLTNHFHPLDIETNQVPFHTLLSACDSWFRVQESKRYATFMFGNRVFNQGHETVDKWIIELERWASRSNFGDYLESAIINQ